MRVRRFGLLAVMMVTVVGFATGIAPAATAEEPGPVELISSPTASLTITNVAEPLAGEESPIFGFEGTVGSFTLGEAESATFAGLEAGDYSVSVSLPAGWVLEGVTCEGVEPTVSAASLTVTLQQGQPGACTFTSHQERVAPPDLPNTGSAWFTMPLLVGGLWALLAGLVLAVWPSMRRADRA